MLELRNRRRRVGGVVLTVLGAACLLWALLAPSASATSNPGPRSLAPEPGQRPMPVDIDALTAPRESCKGIAPTAGSADEVTQKELNEGQGIIVPSASSFVPGGTVHWLVGYSASSSGKRFEVRDCVVAFLPGNDHLAAVLALVDPADHGQLVPLPGSPPDLKAFDTVLDSARFTFPPRTTLPGEFDLSWTIPADTAPGTLVCNYAKTTGGTTIGGKENRKAGGACFIVTSPPTSTTSTSSTSTSTTSTSSTTTSSTSSTTTSSTSTTAPASTSSTATSVTSSTSTTVPSSSSTAPPTSATTLAPAGGSSTTLAPTTRERLPFTGGAQRVALLVAGAVLLSAGIAILEIERRAAAPPVGE